MSAQPVIPSWFKAVAIVSLIWNLMGVMAFIAQVSMTTEMLAALPQAEQDLYANVPLWATVAFACAVFGGAIGCIALMMKKSIATILFIISLLGISIQMFHSFFISNSFEVFGPGGLIMPTMIIIWAAALLVLAKKSQAQQWIS